jgi:hypothetical protein
MGSKTTIILFFIFDLALKNNFLAQAQHALTPFAGKKNFEIMTKTKQLRFFYDIPKVGYPWRIYCIKFTRIHEMENLTLGHL